VAVVLLRPCLFCSPLMAVIFNLFMAPETLSVMMNLGYGCCG
jgi:hypothetical protein